MARTATARVEEQDQPAQSFAERVGGKKDVEHIRVGDVSASIFTNDGTNGTFNTVKFEKSYKDAAGQRKYTDNFNEKDLLELAKAADKAHDRIQELKQERYQGQSR